MKQPLYYNSDVIGYADDVIMENNRIKSIVFYLFETSIKNYIINEIKNSFIATFDDVIDIQNIEHNTLYDFNLKNNVLKINIKI